MESVHWVIGYAVEAESPFVGTWRDTRLGGHPLWPPGEHPDVAKCPSCDRERVLLIQAFAPHALHADRVIMLFGCNSVICSRKPETWLALRAFRRNEDEVPKNEKMCEENAEPVSISKIVNWDTDSDGDEISSTSQSDEDGLKAVEELLALRHLQISLEKAETSLGVKHGADENTVLKAGQSSGGANSSITSACLKPHYVEVAVEPTKCAVADDTGALKKLMEAYEAEEAQLLKIGEVSQWEAEDSEETEASQVVDNFRKVIERAPKQVLRYKFGGDPVWPSHPAPEPQNLSCPHCGASQVFELQLLGSVLYYLKPESVVSNSQCEAALNFLALGMYTCEKDCGVTANEGGDAGSGRDFEYRTQEVRLQYDVW